MKKWKQFWVTLLPYEKVFYVLGLLLALAVIVMGTLSVLQTLEVTYIHELLLPSCLILLGLENLMMAVRMWRTERLNAIVGICCGVFVIACVAIGIFFLK